MLLIIYDGVGACLEVEQGSLLFFISRRTCPFACMIHVDSIRLRRWLVKSNGSAKILYPTTRLNYCIVFELN